MFNQYQLIQLEFVIKYVIRDIKNAKDTTHDDAKWLGELHGLLATVQAEQRHEASKAD